jgi:hypothetical protein
VQKKEDPVKSGREQTISLSWRPCKKYDNLRFVEAARNKGQVSMSSAQPDNRSSASIRLGDVSWERMIQAVKKVRERLRRAAGALESEGCLTR